MRHRSLIDDYNENNFNSLYAYYKSLYDKKGLIPKNSLGNMNQDNYKN